MLQKILAVVNNAPDVYRVCKGLWDRATNKADKEIDIKLKKLSEEYFQQQFIKFKKEINKKTIIYICWSLTGVLVLNIPLTKPVYYISLLLMTIIFLYIVITSVLSLKSFTSFINDFESNVREVLQTKIQEAKQKSWRAKIGLFLSRRSFRNLEDSVIASLVRALLQSVKNHKIILGIRVFAYIVALFLFREVLLHTIHYATTFA